MLDPLISTLQSAAHSLGFPTMRYNSRGVGSSQGCPTWTAEYECMDLRKVCAGIENLILVGYSYGSVIAMSCLDICIAYFSISHPVGVIWLLTCFNSTYRNQLDPPHMHEKKPVNILLVIGAKDNFTSVQKWTEFTNEFKPECKRAVVCQDADHFWRANKDRNWITNQFKSWAREIGVSLSTK